MTIAELFAWHIPPILVPLPTAAADHQTHNARSLERAGAAIHLPQVQLTGRRLDETVGLIPVANERTDGIIVIGQIAVFIVLEEIGPSGPPVHVGRLRRDFANCFIEKGMKNLFDQSVFFCYF